MPTIANSLWGELVVSCQAAPGDPLEDTEAIRRIARAAVAGGGAKGLRVNSADHIAAIRRDTNLPIIGIEKSYVNGALRITPDFASASALAKAGASIIAVDCTARAWTFGEPWRQLIGRIHDDLLLPVMADVATVDEALAAAGAGADFVGTTLHGYTEETRSGRTFNWNLLAEMVRLVGVPVIAEGHISTPDEARRAIAEGAYCVVVGSAITRPGTIAGRFSRAIHAFRAGPPAVAADIGGTSIKAGLISRTGSVSLVEQIPTNALEGREAIAARLVIAIEAVLERAKNQGFVPSGLGIASAGAIDDRDGSVFAATDNLPGWAEFGLREFVEQRFQLPAYVLNDAHAAALSELHFGAGRNLSDFIAITMGTGIGGGVVSNGKLLRGDHGFAGTVGHQVIRIDGRSCNCGRKGCLEAYVSTAALVREYAERSRRSFDAALTESAQAREISGLALGGDRAAQGAYSALAGYLAEGLANLFNLFDPQAVILSGGLVEGHCDFVTDVEERVTRLLHFGVKRKPRLCLATQGQYAGVQGAGALVFAEEAAS